MPKDTKKLNSSGALVYQTGRLPIKRVFIISDEAIRRCADAGLRVVMPSQGNPDITYKFSLNESSGSLTIDITQPSGSRRVLLPAAAFMAELA